ncbi:MAG: DUF86 domain-containing protein [Roseofilum sp. SBFL]|uniref:HepT-like ribonuclease domain-containing protein n=1 Tax=unclassified Roseofilum TaxID=2620099 RepID=UPI001B2A0A68|nr:MULTISPECIES: DUF86 domain-containing protein [unclassified Roseofilum]MBP0015903.1 DUF86 domain-containing protein [Roseofilum sp. SID3]MBP0023887.1 DUF86 domain-containing protein [Roseofilum sp. SID2]MBP0037699.1 DUF86 domain-containing protein [Roseofilum sp. SID1]MBP0042957.1 DUF86 domain-containing protein [Roseofilum sp. SBFL]
MSKNKQALIDILTATEQILRYVQDTTPEDFQQDDQNQAAILYRIIIIGEATKRLSTEFRQKYPIIPWREMAGLRDVVIHDYDDLDFEILWNVVQVNLPDILPKLQFILNQFND